MTPPAATVPHPLAQSPHGQVQSQSAVTPNVRIDCKAVNFWYGAKHALQDINMRIEEKIITAFIGPSGCGKTTFLRMINRMCDVVPGIRYSGELNLDGENLLKRDVDVVALRRKVGMVFQKPNPFPKSIYENVAYGVRLMGTLSRADLDLTVEVSLRKSALWDEVKDKLSKPGTALSGGQQQRLCIARTLAVQPDIILMDEPTAALDPISTRKVEDLMLELAEEYTIVIVTHNMQQASRVSDKTAFFFLGKLIEFGETEQIFTDPKQKQTEDYITGRFG